MTMTAIPALNTAGARAYVSDRLRLPVEAVITTPLSGGVSNDVVLVETPDSRFVLKQALGQLRVRENWFSDRDRILREARALERLAPLLPSGALPQVLFVDPAHFCYAMTAAPPDAEMWKSKLMRGEVSLAVAAALGKLHGALLQMTWNTPEWNCEFGDQTAFEQLRLHPYYEFTAKRYPEFRPQFQAAQEQCRHQRVSLVHGDWSPKNIMVSGESLMVIDFEVVHYGHPAFDTAFLLNHLILKSFHLPAFSDSYKAAAQHYWRALSENIPEQASSLERATLAQLPLLMLARMDGKSPVEYIQDNALRQNIRQYAQALLHEPPANLPEVWERLPQ